MLKTRLGKIVITPITKVFETLANFFKGATDALGGPTPSNAPNDPSGPAGGRLSKTRDADANPLDENTAALDRNTAAMQRITGMVGGGERAQNALPPALFGPRGRGAALVDSARDGALKTGNL
jgi:hypothetical protein